MNIVSVVLEPNADGTLHLPLPAELRGGKIKVVAELTPIDAPKRVRAGILKDLPGKFWMASDFDEPLEDFREYME